MNAKTAVALTAVLAAGLARAQSAPPPPPPLDLDLPPSASAAAPAAGGKDSPGLYYGDVGGADDREGDGPGAPPADGRTEVHGSFSTGIGYSKGYGTGTTDSAELDVSKRTEDGRAFDLHLDVSRGSGPFAYPGYGYYGPRGR